MWGYPPSNAMERRQEAVERMYEREDEELAERIAAERFDEHKGKWSEHESQDNRNEDRV